ncbi:MAG: DAK2 domain-containing protein, partial [Dehalococcoidia bacterium]|nr:DAK2 domain-containing protein [Dehalococcoidia bacterium]
MAKTDSIQNGQTLQEMFLVATNWLEKSASDIDVLNVFPVPDGDTGTNMLLTMRCTMEEAQHTSDTSTSAVIQAMAKGALIGARGNSGVILSQILRGLAEGLAGKTTFNGIDFAQALLKASSTAYRALSEPVEGTILTVIRDSALAAQEIAPLHPNDLTLIMESVTQAARNSVAKTTSLNPVLQEAGVVDAGGQGLYIIFEGILLYLTGEAEEIKYRKKPGVVPSNTPQTPRVMSLHSEIPYGYCTNFVLRGNKLNVDRIRNRLKGKGKDVMVVGDEEIIKVHINTPDPGTILKYVSSKGTLHEIDIQNMDDLHTRFVEKSKSQIPAPGIAIVAILSGDGLTKVFGSLGATAVILGGQTMNPSVRDILHAVERLPQDKI